LFVSGGSILTEEVKQGSNDVVVYHLIAGIGNILYLLNVHPERRGKI